MLKEQIEQMMASEPSLSSEPDNSPAVADSPAPEKQDFVFEANLFEDVFTAEALNFLSDLQDLKEDDTVADIFNKSRLTIDQIFSESSVLFSEFVKPLKEFKKVDPLESWAIEKTGNDQEVAATKTVKCSDAASASKLVSAMIDGLDDEDYKISVTKGQVEITVCSDINKLSSLTEIVSKLSEASDTKQTLSDSTAIANDPETTPNPDDYIINLSNSFSLGYSNRDDKYLLKIPIASLGMWKHPIYGDLDFSEEKIYQMETNLINNVTGYPIPLYIGHQQEDSAKCGTLMSFSRDPETKGLYGVWKVDKQTYRSVEDGQYEFSSAEIYPNYMSKQTGTRVGKTLVGMALTNRPFIPDQPPVEALSDDNRANDAYILSASVKAHMVDYDSIEGTESCQKETPFSEGNSSDSQDDINVKLGESQTMSTENNTDILVEPNTATEAVTSAPEVAQPTQQPQTFSDDISELKQQLADYSTKLGLVEETYKAQLSEAATKNQELEARIQKYEEKLQAEELDKKLTWLSELNLPQATKEKYSELIKEGSLGEAEETVMQSLKELSQNFTDTFTTQVGSSTGTEDLNNQKFEDPFKNVIERNNKLVEARRGTWA